MFKTGLSLHAHRFLLAFTKWPFPNMYCLLLTSNSVALTCQLLSMLT